MESIKYNKYKKLHRCNTSTILGILLSLLWQWRQCPIRFNFWFGIPLLVPILFGAPQYQFNNNPVHIHLPPAVDKLYCSYASRAGGGALKPWACRKWAKQLWVIFNLEEGLRSIAGSLILWGTVPKPVFFFSIQVYQPELLYFFYKLLGGHILCVSPKLELGIKFGPMVSVLTWNKYAIKVK